MAAHRQPQLVSYVVASVAFAALFCGCLSADYEWPVQKEFSFWVQGQDLAGLPQLKAQYAGFRYNGELRVQTHTSRILLLKMINMTYFQIHEELPEGWWKGPENISQNCTKPLPLTTSTVVVKLTKSTSPELVMQAGLEDWHVNFIKGVVTHILPYLSDSNLPRPNSNIMSNSQERDVYSVMEDSVAGQCEVLYEVSPLPQYFGLYDSKLCSSDQLWEVIKTRNYNNCRLLSEDHAHLPVGDCTPGGANCGHFWTRASVTQMLGCGKKNDFVLLSSVSSSVMNAHLHLQNNTLAVVNSNLNITLSFIRNLKNKFNPPQNKHIFKTLLYTYSSSSKDLYSRPCQDDGSQEENDDDTDLQSGEAVTQVDNSQHDENSNESDQPQQMKGRSKKLQMIRNKRGLKKTSEKSGKKSSKSEKEKNVNNISSSHPSKHNSEKSSGHKGKAHKPHESSEFYEQPSEELELEEEWMISDKDTKNLPPHQPFSIFSLAHRSSDDFNCLNGKLHRIITEIANDLENIDILPDKHTLDKISAAVDMCRAMPLEQLKSISKEVFEVNSEESNNLRNNERKVFRDVVTMSGTHPALLLIKKWLENGLVKGEEAAEIVASFPSRVFSPNSYIIQDFFEMVQKIEDKSDDDQLTTTAVLALSNFVRGACVNPSSRQNRFSSIVKPICEPRLATQISIWLTHQVDSDPDLQRVYIEALGNIGSPQVIEVLRNIALDENSSSYSRSSAVFSMRYQVLHRNPTMVPLLLSLYHNYSLPVPTRIAAVSMLFYADPGLTTWQRLAISTWYERSPAIAHFVASSIRSMAYSHDPLYSQLSKSAYLVLPLARTTNVHLHLPQNLLSSFWSDDLLKVILEQLSWMQFYEYSTINYRHTSRSCGFSRTNIDASFNSANPDALWSALKELIVSTNQRARPASGLVSNTLDKMQEKLDIRHRPMPALQADLRIKVNNILERMIYINKNTFKNLAKDGRQLVSDVMQQGLSLSYQKADMDCFHISTTTELGFPVEFSVRTPWIIQAKTKINITDQGIVLGVSFVYSSQLQSSINMLSSWDGIVHSAGAYATNFVQLPPLQVVARLDSAGGLRLTSAFVQQHRLLYFSMQPFTSQRKADVQQVVLLSQDTNRVRLGNPTQTSIPWMTRYLKTVYSAEENEHFNSMSYIKNARSVLGFPMLMPNMEPRTFETVMNSLHPIVMNFSMSIASKSKGELQYHSPAETIVARILNVLTNELDHQSLNSDEFVDFSTGAKQNSLENHNNKKDSSSSSDYQPKSTTVKPDVSQEMQAVGNDQDQQEPTSTSGIIQNKPVFEKRRSHLQIKDNSQMESPSQNFAGFKVYPSTYDSTTGNFNASQVDPFNNGNGHSYLIEQILSKIDSGEAIVFGLGMTGGDAEQTGETEVFAAFANTYSDRVQRFGFFVKKDSSQLRMTAAHEAPLDIASNLKDRVQQDLRHSFFVDYVSSVEGTNTESSFQASFGASRDKLEELRASPQLESCTQMNPHASDSLIGAKCQSLHAQTKEIGFANITIYYNENAKFIEYMTQMYMNTARVMLPKVGEKPGGGYNTVRMSFDINHRSESMDAYVSVPTSSIVINRIPLAKLPNAALVEWAMQLNVPREYCGVSNHRVMTFDGAEIHYSMERNVQHLLIHDCSGKFGLSLVAELTSNTTLEAELNIDDYFIITMKEGPQVLLNGNLQLMNATIPLLVLTNLKGQVIAKVFYTPDNTIRVRLPSDGLDLTYSGTSLIVRAQPGLQGRLCGLCGAYTNTGVERFLTADGSPATSHQEFISSYTIRH